MAGSSSHVGSFAREHGRTRPAVAHGRLPAGGMATRLRASRQAAGKGAEMKDREADIVQGPSDSGRRAVLRRRVRVLLVLVVFGLLVSGVTAFPIRHEMELLMGWLGVPPDASHEQYSGILGWLVRVHNGLRDMYDEFPWIAYGTDWLAFAHVLLAVLFVGAAVDPVRNIWVIRFGLIACAGVIPLALICGPIRGIPFYWRLIDCAFGVAAFVPLFLAHRFTTQLAVLQNASDRTGEK